MDGKILAGLVVLALVAAVTAGTSLASGRNQAVTYGTGMDSMHGSMDMHSAGSMHEMDIEDMDVNLDGVCDMCGMQVEACKGMMNGVPDNEKGMMKMMEAMHGEENEGGCHQA